MDLECKRHIYIAMAISLVILTVVVIGDSIISPITIIALKYGVPMQYLEMQVIRVIIQCCKLLLPFVVAMDVSVIMAFLADTIEQDR